MYRLFKKMQQRLQARWRRQGPQGTHQLRLLTGPCQQPTGHNSIGYSSSSVGFARGCVRVGHWMFQVGYSKLHVGYPKFHVGCSKCITVSYSIGCIAIGYSTDASSLACKMVHHRWPSKRVHRGFLLKARSRLPIGIHHRRFYRRCIIGGYAGACCRCFIVVPNDMLTLCPILGAEFTLFTHVRSSRLSWNETGAASRLAHQQAISFAKICEG